MMKVTGIPQSNSVLEDDTAAVLMWGGGLEDFFTLQTTKTK
jgi:hypothetical protein